MSIATSPYTTSRLRDEIIKIGTKVVEVVVRIVTKMVNHKVDNSTRVNLWNTSSRLIFRFKI